MIYGRHFEPIPENEPTFLLRATDRLAPGLMRFYANELARAGASIEMQDSVLRHANAMELYQQEHGSKVPDLPPAQA